MAKPTSLLYRHVPLLLLILTVPASLAAPPSSLYSAFLHCLTQNTNSSSTQLANILFDPTNPSFSTVLQDYIRNARMNTSSTPKPLIIVTPSHESHVQAAVLCAKSIGGVRIKIRSGGHDYDGLSYVSDEPFVVLDMFSLKSVTVDVTNSIAVVQAGA